MKKLSVLLLLAFSLNCYAQGINVESFRQAVKTAKTDSARYVATWMLGLYYLEVNRDSALYYLEKCLLVARRYNHKLDAAGALTLKGYELRRLKKFPEALLCLQQALKLAEDPENRNDRTWATGLDGKTPMPRPFWLPDIHLNIGELLGDTGDTTQQITQYKESARIAEKYGDQFSLGLANSGLGNFYFSINQLDSALLLEKKAEGNYTKSGNVYYITYVYHVLGDIYLKKGNHQLALQYFYKAPGTDIKLTNLAGLSDDYAKLAAYYLGEKQPDSSLLYAKKNLEILHTIASKDLGDAYERLYKCYQLRQQTDSAYKYQGLALAAKDSSNAATTKSLADFQKLSFNDQLRLQALEKEKEQAQTRIRIYALSAAIAVFMLLAIIFWRNNRQKQKANHLLSDQKEEIQRQRDNLGQALEELKSTQTQLVQREKMASLGELTAGIAHEIQNPLNFVNNFSEVNAELIDEMQHEIDNGDLQEVKAIAMDIQQNEKKINMHGKRADAIVKGMLEHSRSHSGQKEPTNLNAMADECMRISYHGLRAKDKAFESELVTHFDPGLPKIEVVPQDIGRVLLNLFNNAYYAVNQKAKIAGGDYKPEVSVSTALENGSVKIVVKDNGIGIPDAIKEKIMQPFFTTKPTGEGTGLGLSLTYDMVVKGHGGSIQVDSVEGKGSEFIVTLPIN